MCPRRLVPQPASLQPSQDLVDELAVLPQLRPLEAFADIHLLEEVDELVAPSHRGPWLTRAKEDPSAEGSRRAPAHGKDVLRCPRLLPKDVPRGSAPKTVA